MRGGTSKGVFFQECDMPVDRSRWPSFLLDVMGSPDGRQIDGLGGATALTSKVAVINPSGRRDADVDYTFAQVGLADSVVDMKSNCGNISSAVGPYALFRGLITPPHGAESVVTRIHNTNTGKLIEAEIPLRDGRFVPEGEASIPGVPGTASPIFLLFSKPAGAVTGKLLPTGKAVDRIVTSRGSLEISIVDAANPLVFMRAEDVGLTGTECPADFDGEMLAYLEEIRSIAAEMCGFAARSEATRQTPAVPKTTVLRAPVDYTATDGSLCAAGEMDVVVRMMAMQRPHEALPMTGATCITTAAAVPGTLVHQLAPRSDASPLRIGHPAGIMRTVPGMENGSVTGVKVLRTARVLAEGRLFTKGDY
jgi:2-methylaconitate cis-trans-isomerase PrpF